MFFCQGLGWGSAGVEEEEGLGQQHPFRGVVPGPSFQRHLPLSAQSCTFDFTDKSPISVFLYSGAVEISITGLRGKSHGSCSG